MKCDIVVSNYRPVTASCHTLCLTVYWREIVCVCVCIESLDLFYAAQGLTLLIFTQAVMARHARNATLLSAQE